MDEARGPRVVFPPPEQLAEVERIERAVLAEGPYRPLPGVVCAAAFAAVGAASWAVLTAATGLQLGVVALLVGILAGVGAARGGRGRAGQVIGAGAALAGCLLGELLCLAAAYAGAATEALVLVDPQLAMALEARGHATVPLDAAFDLAWRTYPDHLARELTSVGVVLLALAVFQAWSIPRRPA